jgi:hypothetical protein
VTDRKSLRENPQDRKIIPGGGMCPERNRFENFHILIFPQVLRTIISNTVLNFFLIWTSLLYPQVFRKSSVHVTSFAYISNSLRKRRKTVDCPETKSENRKCMGQYTAKGCDSE